MRLKLARLKTNSRPATRFREAEQRVQQMQERPVPSPLNPVSRTIFLSHGVRTRRAVLLLHGYTNSPQQFRQLGQLFFEQGCNVLIPRMPHHGLAQRLNKELGKLTGEQLVAFATEACDIAIGLGEELTVMGLSAGGILTGWLASQRADIDTAILISPAFGATGQSVGSISRLTRLALALPNLNIWWGERGDLSGLAHAYPRWSTRGLAHIFRVGVAIRRSARRNAPQAKQLVIVENENDGAISHLAVARLRRDLERNNVAYEHHVFPPSDDLDHDLIDPMHEKAQPDLVYPILLRLGLHL
ncbi:MAG: alpha/beta hydrolase [Candidatus Promineifilaceae bacterium]